MTDLSAAALGLGATALVAAADKAPKVNTFCPVDFGAAGDLSKDDTQALVDCCAAAAAARGAVDLGTGQYLVSGPITNKLTTPITIFGNSEASAVLVVDPAFSGDLLSFSNCWFGAESVINYGGATVFGNPITGQTWPNPVTSRKNGVVLRNFRIVGDRRTSNQQNGVMFYDRNDKVHIEGLEIEFMKGVGLGLSGLTSSPSTNAATCMRESHIRARTRWCGRQSTASPSVVMNANSKTVAQGGLTSGDDCNNYNSVDLEIIFSQGVAFQCDEWNINSNHMHDNTYKIIVDGMFETDADPTVISGGAVDSAHWSITNGVLTISAGATFTRYAGVGTGSIIAGLFLVNAGIPAGTYISAITSGPGAAGAGVYQLAHKNLDISTFSLAGSSTLRLTTPMISIGGGHISEKFSLTVNNSSLNNSNSVALVINQNPLHASTPKMQQCEVSLSVGLLDVGVHCAVANSFDLKLPIYGPQVTMVAGNITNAVSIDTMTSAAEPFFSGSIQNVFVKAGGRNVLYGSSITLNASKWPNAVFYLDNAGTRTRYMSVPAGPTYATASWVAI